MAQVSRLRDITKEFDRVIAALDHARQVSQLELRVSRLEVDMRRVLTHPLSGTQDVHADLRRISADMRAINDRIDKHLEQAIAAVDELRRREEKDRQ